jgi:hypothetical protein
MSKIFGYHTSELGTQVPLLDLKGKPYLQVSHRLVLFREKFPSGIIKTQMLSHQENTAVFRAEVYITDLTSGQPMLVATGHKTESKASFADYMEKSETGAIGRALALAGIGTQFCEVDLDEKDRLADAPVEPAKKAAGSLRSRVNKAVAASEVVVGDVMIGDDI